MNRWIEAAIIAGVIGLTVAGCSTFSPAPDRSRFFTLAPAFQPAQGAERDPAISPDLSLGIGPVSLPGYLDREELVSRIAQNRIDISGNDRWAEPLEANFTRVLAQDLTALLRPKRIAAYPWPVSYQPLYQVEIEVLRFERSAAQEVQLSARWGVRETGKNDAIRYRETRLTRPAKGRSTEASVAALSEALGELSREIADAIQTLHGGAN